MKTTRRFLSLLFSASTSINPLLAQWVQTNGPCSGSVYALAGSGTNLLAGTAFGGVFLLTNNGTSWSAIDSGLTNSTVYALAVSATNLFAGTYSGVFLSSNSGTSWTEVNTGMKDTVLSLAVIGTNLFAGTYGGWVWRRPLSEMITSVEMLSAAIHTHFSLAQNYPNPFNPSTSIKFEIPQSGFVSITVFNLLGEKVASLVSERLNAGKYITKWNASISASGVYFYRLQVGDFSLTKKLVLFR